MKKRALTQLYLLCLICPVFAQESDSPAVPAPQPPKRVAVYIAGQETRATQGLHRILAGELTRAIDRSDKYSAIERTASVLATLDKELWYMMNRGDNTPESRFNSLGFRVARSRSL